MVLVGVESPMFGFCGSVAVLVNRGLVSSHNRGFLTLFCKTGFGVEEHGVIGGVAMEGGSSTSNLLLTY